ncbi:unnamed protein product, partial [Closterium sp. NIES-54]
KHTKQHHHRCVATYRVGRSVRGRDRAAQRWLQQHGSQRQSMPVLETHAHAIAALMGRGGSICYTGLAVPSRGSGGRRRMEGRQWDDASQALTAVAAAAWQSTQVPKTHACAMPLCCSYNSPAAATTHQLQLQLTSFSYNSPAAATTHQLQLQLTSCSYNSPAAATTHQLQLQLTSFSYNSPAAATTHQLQLQLTSFSYNSPAAATTHQLQLHVGEEGAHGMNGTSHFQPLRFSLAKFPLRPPRLPSLPIRLFNSWQISRHIRPLAHGGGGPWCYGSRAHVECSVVGVVG